MPMLDQTPRRLAPTCAARGHQIDNSHNHAEEPALSPLTSAGPLPQNDRSDDQSADHVGAEKEQTKRRCCVLWPPIET